MEYDTGTIRQTLDRLHREGMNITENTLRVWVRTGVLPAAFCGKKAYISQCTKAAAAGHPTTANRDHNGQRNSQDRLMQNSPPKTAGICFKRGVMIWQALRK